jgi:putative oxidoreductase
MTDTTPRPPRSIIAWSVDRLVALLALLPYSLVALALRLVMARAFFLSGQAKIEGPSVPIHTPWLDVSITLPAAIKDATLTMFETQYADLPMPPAFAAAVFAYAEFVLPICLVIGFATRFAALGLLALTVLLQLYVMPGMWWAAHVYWGAILLVLISLGPGVISIDALFRYLYRRLV